MSARKIIVGYDGSVEARAAADWALDEASRTGAPLEFCHAYEWPVSVPPSAMAPAPAVWPSADDDRAVEEMLDGLATRAAQSHPGVIVSTVIRHAPAAVTLIDRSAGAGLIVLGSRAHSKLAGLLGSVTVSVGTHARCPVVVVRGRGLPADPIVAGVDRSDDAVRALAFAFEQAAGRGAALRVIRAWLPPALEWSGSPAVLEASVAIESTSLTELVRRWREKYPTVPVTTEVAVENPGRALAEASLHAQLVVVGTREHGPLRGALLGSVSRHLLHHAKSSIAIVREPLGTSWS